MLSTWDVIQNYKRLVKSGEADKLPYKFSEDFKGIYDSETGEYVCSMDSYMAVLRRKMHCDFECIFHEHASLTTIYRCNECGAIIFTGDDERYDPNLKCPVCGDYKHWGTYWSKEDLDSDPEKQKELQMYLDWQKEMVEAEKRRELRGGLYDWQVFVKKWYGKKHFFGLELTDFGRNLGHTERNKPWYKRMIELEVSIGDKDGISYTVNRHFSIPLSPYAFYVKHIFRYTKKCTSDLRKYFPWQKKPEKKEESVSV